VAAKEEENAYPTKRIEIIVPAGTGGGADQMARMMQGIITKYNLSKQSVVVINKSGGAGGEGFLDVKNSKGDEHKLIITLSNLFTTPLATGIPFKWKDLTPVAMMALDETAESQEIDRKNLGRAGRGTKPADLPIEQPR
jgi:putative tricarboxylic transport membrane protein